MTWDYKQNIFSETDQNGTESYTLEWKNVNCFILKDNKSQNGKQFVLVRTVCSTPEPRQGNQSLTKKITKKCSICGGTGLKKCSYCEGNGAKNEDYYEWVWENGKYVYKFANRYKSCTRCYGSGQVECYH